MRTLLALMLLTLGLPSAFGEEVPAPQAPPRDAARERAAAGEIGRDLLARDRGVRARAVKRLLARIERGGDLHAFLESMGDAVADWADRRERLMERWIEQAVHGSAREREQAARLLHALGPDAVGRLAEELRHARGLGSGAPRDDGSPQAEGEESEDASDKPTAPAQAARPEAKKAEEPKPPVCCAPGIYDVKDLGKLGLNAVQLRSLLQKVPDASEVKDLGQGVYVVTASPDGHRALRTRLDRMRVRAANPNTHNKVAASARRFDIVPTVYRVPPGVLGTGSSQKGVGGYGASPSKANAELPRGLDPSRTEVHTGTAMDAALWMRALQAGPKGVRGQVARAEDSSSVVAAGANTVFFQGRERRYRKGLVRGKGGAWTVEHGTLRVGLDLDVALVVEGDEVVVYLVAANSEIAEPMPVDRIQRSPKELPIELDRPEWSRTRTRTSFRLPTTGGAAFLSLGGLGPVAEGHLVVVLRVAPVTQKAAQQSAR